MPLLEVHNVSKRFGGLAAVDSVSFQIEEGELVALVGPNGAGKTSLFHTIGGYHKADAGTIRFAGHDITRMPAHRRARLGLARTFQIPRPFGGATVRENAAMGALFGAAQPRMNVRRALEEADRCLARVGLAGLENHAAADLTPVQQKLLEIARSLAMHPRLLLLDEAMAGMNPTEVDSVVALIRSLHEEEHIAVVGLVEHIMRAVVGLARRVLVMHQGKLLIDAPTEQALTDPRVVEVYLGHAAAPSNS